MSQADDNRIKELEDKVDWLEHCLRNLAAGCWPQVGDNFNKWMSDIWEKRSEKEDQ